MSNKIILMALQLIVYLNIAALIYLVDVEMHDIQRIEIYANAYTRST